MFNRKPAAEPEPATITGTAVLRAATASRRRAGHLARTAGDLQVAVAALDSFADGGSLPEPVLQALAKELFRAELDVAQDRLRELDPPEATPLGLRTPNYDPASNVYPGPVDLTAAKVGFSPGPNSTLSKPYSGKRPGWE